MSCTVPVATSRPNELTKGAQNSGQVGYAVLICRWSKRHGTQAGAASTVWNATAVLHPMAQGLEEVRPPACGRLPHNSKMLPPQAVTAEPSTSA